MTTTEQRYALIKKESFAFTWACERLSDYLIGLKFHIYTDHKPLVPLFSTKNLEELPVRAQRFRLRMLRFHFKISHVPGKQLTIADMLSQAPTEVCDYTNQELEQDSQVFVNSVIASLLASEQLQRIKQFQQSDHVCKQSLQFCQTKWSSKSSFLEEVKLYYSVSAEISIENGLIIRGSRIIIPLELQPEMLTKIHDGHLGITKCRARARQAIWWPGLPTTRR